jgi:peptidoglycan DL-endopeptidase LytE
MSVIQVILRIILSFSRLDSGLYESDSGVRAVSIENPAQSFAIERSLGSLGLVPILSPMTRRFLLACAAALLMCGSASAKSYTVQPGDTLFGIAKANNVSLTRLLMINRLTGEQVQPGQVLEIPSGASLAKVSPQRSTSSVSGNRPSVSRTAYRFIGARYVYGSSGPYNFDCSGFTRYVLGKQGVNLPHSAAQQARMGRFVRRSGLMPGDLVFFNTMGRGVSHVAVYVGDNKVVHATNPHDGVVVSSLSERYWSARYVGARRVL